MADATPPHRGNQILQRLSEPQLARLAPDLEPVDLPHAMQLEAPGAAIAHACFPTEGLAVMVAANDHGERVEAGLFGRDGMSGLALVMGSDRAPHQTVVQLAGRGVRIAARPLRAAIAADPALHGLLLRYAQAAAIQAAHTALAHARYGIEERLARWLLMCGDRVDDQTLPLTHELLATMLGVRRAGVTVAVHVLEGQGLIRATRGRIRVLDRAGLIEAACGSYGAPEAEHARLLGERAEQGTTPTRPWDHGERHLGATGRPDRSPAPGAFRN